MIDVVVEPGEQAVMNVGTWLCRTAARYPEKVAVRFGERSLTWRQLEKRCLSLAKALTEHGIGRGHRVALVQPNGIEFLESLFGCLVAGCTVVPVNFALHPREVVYIVQNSEASAIIHGGSRSPELIALNAEMPGIKLHVALEKMDGATAYEELLAESDSDILPAEVTGDDVAWLFYTSGTTGKPKGVIWTHRMIRIMVMNYLADVYSLQSDDVVLHMAPMSHGSGTTGMAAVARGAETVILDTPNFDPDRAFELIEQRDVTNIAFAAPTQIVKMLQARSIDNHDLSSLRCCCYGGAPMYVEDLNKALAKFGPVFVQIFGQGEAPMTITYLTPADHMDTSHPERLGSAGTARTDVEVKIAGAEDAPQGAQHSGEILVRGDIVMPGYWRNPEATAEVIRDGWLNTGDVGYLDESGYLYIQDRTKDVVISGGNNIYPREVEEVILTLSGVRECSVFGIPDDYWGEALHAVVSLEEGAEVSDADIIAHCAGHLAGYKKPKSVDIMNDLPKSSYGKILKRELRDPYWEGLERMVGGGAESSAGEPVQ